MRILGYLFSSLVYIGAGGIFVILLLATGLHIYRKGLLPFLFGLSFDEFEIIVTVLVQPLTWILAAVAAAGLLGKGYVARRRERETP